MAKVLEIFVDASALIALSCSQDAHHEKAKVFIQETSDDVIFSTTRLVYYEALTVASQKYGLFEAKVLRDHFKHIPFKFYEIDETLVSKAEFLLFSQSSKNLPFFDCLYASIMKSNAVKKIFTYDRDFRKLGVTMVG